jgi:molybdopterin molybdotransferase
VLSSGGVSVGEEDHVRAAVELAGRLEMWKIAIKPGKPLAFGHLATDGREVPFVGLPGNPVSCLVTFLMLVRPLLLRMQGVRAGGAGQLPAARRFRLAIPGRAARVPARAEQRRRRRRALRQPGFGRPDLVGVG